MEPPQRGERSTRSGLAAPDHPGRCGRRGLGFCNLGMGGRRPGRSQPWTGLARPASIKRRSRPVHRQAIAWIVRSHQRAFLTPSAERSAVAYACPVGGCGPPDGVGHRVVAVRSRGREPERHVPGSKPARIASRPARNSALWSVMRMSWRAAVAGMPCRRCVQPRHRGTLVSVAAVLVASGARDPDPAVAASTRSREATSSWLTFPKV
jgi:hypothetical protein